MEPRKNWIAYVDDARYPNKDKDELALINPDTKEIIYLAGSKTESTAAFVGFGPSWDALGEKIALGDTRFENPTGIYPVRRISIYSDVFSGAPRRERLHSESYLKSYFGSRVSEIYEGIFNTAWSPDNNLITYNVTGGPYGRGTYSYYLNAGSLAIAAADGSGIKNILTDVIAKNMSWSPDSQHIIFERIFPDSMHKHICMVDKNGDNYIDINEMIGKANKSYGSPTWAK